MHLAKEVDRTRFKVSSIFAYVVPLVCPSVFFQMDIKKSKVVAAVGFEPTPSK